MRVRTFMFSIFVFSAMALDFVNAADSQPLRIEALIRVGPEAAVIAPNTITVSASLALGMTEFNSPYILGGNALQIQLTCNACHSPEGMSGAASKLTLSKPLPDFFHQNANTMDKNAKVQRIAGFVRAALPREFQSLDVPENVVAGLALYLADWSDRRESPTTRQEALVQVGPWAMVQLGTELAQHSICNNDFAQADLLIETVRFYLGEIHNQAQSSDGEIRYLAKTLNRQLHAADDYLLKGNALFALQKLAEAETEMRASHRQEMVLVLAGQSDQVLKAEPNKVGGINGPKELNTICKP